MNGLLWQRKPQKPQANDTISLGMIESDLVLTSGSTTYIYQFKNKGKTHTNARENCKTERKTKKN